MAGSQRPQVPQVAVSGQAVMEALHEKYGGLIATIMQENAQAAAAIEAVQRRNLELEQQVAALRDAAGVRAVQQRPAQAPAAAAVEPDAAAG